MMKMKTLWRMMMRRKRMTKMNMRMMIMMKRKNKPRAKRRNLMGKNFKEINPYLVVSWTLYQLIQNHRQGRTIKEKSHVQVNENFCYKSLRRFCSHGCPFPLLTFLNCL